MPIIKIVILYVSLLISIPVNAGNENECLSHLGGGGMADFECYATLTNTLQVENKKLIEKISIKLKENKRNRLNTFSRYVRNTSLNEKYCELLREGERSGEEGNGHIRYYDVMYAECIYKRSVSENDYLINLSSAWKVSK
jgi:hypothetical protein